MSTPPQPPPDDGGLNAKARAAAARLRAAGHTAYWAGGCVRDLLLKRSPKDYDIATGATPDQVLALFPRAIAVGKSFGVVRVPVEDAWFEVATFRRDHGYQDGRHPTTVEFSDARTDAERRDFTINALFYDPASEEVLDFVEGRADLERRIIRAVGEPGKRFQEDHLRLLRAVRFAHTLDFALEPVTAAAIRAHAGLIARVSVERTRDEFTRILIESSHPGRALTALLELGLLDAFLPEVVALKAQAQPPQFHPEGDVFTHTAIMLDMMDPPELHLAYAILFHDIGKPRTATLDGERIRFNGHAEVGATMTTDIMRRMRFANDDIDAVVAAVRGHMHFQDVTKMRRSTLRAMVGRPYFPTELELHRIDCLSSHGDLALHRHVQDFQAALAAEPALPPPWISGRDVMDLGVTEGPDVGRWLRHAYEAQLEGRLPTRDELLAWLHSEISSA